jgi:hypothetical protein
MLRLRITAVLAAVSLLFACTSKASAPTQDRGPTGGTLRVGMVLPVYYGLDPQQEWSYATWEFLRCCLVRTLMSYRRHHRSGSAAGPRLGATRDLD